MQVVWDKDTMEIDLSNGELICVDYCKDIIWKVERLVQEAIRGKEVRNIHLKTGHIEFADGSEYKSNINNAGNNIFYFESEPELFNYFETLKPLGDYNAEEKLYELTGSK